MLMAALPVLLRVALCAVLLLPTGWLPKARLVGERPATGAVPVPPVPVPGVPVPPVHVPGVHVPSVPVPGVPVPDTLIACGLTVALSVRVTAAARVPLAAGVKAALVVQLVRAATLAPQSLACAKALA